MFFVTKQLNRIEKHANTSENTVFLSVIFLREDSLHFNYAYTATVSRIVNLKSKIVSNSPENRTETYRKVILKFCKFTRRVVLTKPTYVTQKKNKLNTDFFNLFYIDGKIRCFQTLTAGDCIRGIRNYLL